jgi:oligopeptide/dipeptide ABC transporter ATP-binding protein
VGQEPGAIDPAVLLELDGLTTVFPTRRGLVRAVDGLSFRLRRGEKLGIVGESGSGKSVTLLSILRLVPPPGRIVKGGVRFRGEDLGHKSERDLRAMRGKEVAMIFQDPMTTLNPAFRVGDQVRESLRIHHIIPPPNGRLPRLLGRGRRAAEDERVWQAMADVGIPVPEQNARRYPHQFSGGMQQRALTAIALACEPQVLLADEPTTALDVTIQAQIMALLDQINARHGAAIVLVTHNLGLVAEFCENILVMYAGQLLEKGTASQVIDEPKHPYTRGLLACLPKIRAQREKILPIPGLVPDLAHLPPGCSFSPRCAEAMPDCSRVEAVPLTSLADGRRVRCLLYG